VSVLIAHPAAARYNGAMSITAGLTAAKAAIEVAKLLMDKLNTPDLSPEVARRYLLEMLDHAVNTQVALADAATERAQLMERVRELQTNQTIDDDMEFQIDGGFYLRKSESAKGVIAYCPLCWKKDRITVPLKTTTERGHFWCVLHKAAFDTKACLEARRSVASNAGPVGRPFFDVNRQF
jgi:hypothetical protein